MFGNEGLPIFVCHWLKASSASSLDTVTDRRTLEHEFLREVILGLEKLRLYGSSERVVKVKEEERA